MSFDIKPLALGYGRGVVRCDGCKAILTQFNYTYKLYLACDACVSKKITPNKRALRQRMRLVTNVRRRGVSRRDTMMNRTKTSPLERYCRKDRFKKNAEDYFGPINKRGK